MVVGLLMTKKTKSKGTVSQRYNPPKQMLDAIASLEEKLMPSEIKIGDVTLEEDAEPKKATPIDTPSEEPQAPQDEQEQDENAPPKPIEEA